MVLLDHIIQIFHLADDDRCPVLGIVSPDRRGIGLARIDGDLLRHLMAANGLGDEVHGRLLTVLLRQEEINGLAVIIYGTIQIAPLPLHPADVPLANKCRDLDT